jgi:hypothetical protein
MTVGTNFATRLTRLATGVVHDMVTMNITDVLVSLSTALMLGATAVLVLFSLMNDVRTRTRINFMRGFVFYVIAVHRRLDFTTLLVLRTRVMMVNTSMTNAFVFVMAVVVCLVTLHGSLLRSCNTG